MDTLTIIIAASAGLALGYATAAHFASQARHTLLGKLKTESHALKEAQAKFKELKAADTSQESEKNAKKFEKRARDTAREVERLKNKTMAAEKCHVDALAKVQLELEEAKAKSVVAQPTINPELQEELSSVGSALDGILATLIKHEGQTGVLLGDINGIVIAKSGDADTIENAAAACNTLLSLPKRLEGMLPMNKYFTYNLQDGKNAIAGHAFQSDGEVIALMTVGPQAPATSSIDAVVQSLTTALE